MMTKVLAGAVMTLLVGDAAAAQQPAASAAQTTSSQGTMVPIESGFVIAPDARFTDVNDRSATLAGAYGGWMTEHTVLIGGGAYWLANDARDFKMMYAGPVVEWMVRGERRIAFGARGLVGGGRATIGGTVGDLFGVSADQDADTILRNGRGGRSVVGRTDRRLTSTSNVIVRDDFFIVEPQAIISIRATDWLHVDTGVGYRLITGAGPLNDRLRGVSGTLSVKFGGG
jgi:hypothetical protein